MSGKFKVGDRVIQTGTSTRSSHHNQIGTVVSTNEESIMYTILVEFRDGECDYTEDGIRYFFVKEKDYCYIRKLTKLEQALK